MLFRQDPKKPDYASYLRNRKAVSGYNAWVIPSDEGLSLNDVQFPYSNLAEYLSSRKFYKVIFIGKKIKKVEAKPS